MLKCYLNVLLVKFQTLEIFRGYFENFEAVKLGIFASATLLSENYCIT